MNEKVKQLQKGKRDLQRKGEILGIIKQRRAINCLISGRNDGGIRNLGSKENHSSDFF